MEEGDDGQPIPSTLVRELFPCPGIRGPESDRMLLPPVTLPLDALEMNEGGGPTTPILIPIGPVIIPLAVPPTVAGAEE